jgi:uncharacterized protein
MAENARLQEAERKETAGVTAAPSARFFGLRISRRGWRGSRNAGADATRIVALEQETFAIGAVNWRMIDASGTPDPSLRSARVSLLAVPGEH